MEDANSSLVVTWFGSTTAQGFALGAVLGPAGMLLAFLLSSRNKRTERLFGALKGSIAASIVILVVLAVVVFAFYAF